MYNSISRHCHQFEKIYKVGEEYFDKIENLKERFSEWTAMGSVDVEDLSKNVLKTADDWDRYFRNAKTKAQEIIKLNWYIKYNKYCFHHSFMKSNSRMLPQ